MSNLTGNALQIDCFGSGFSIVEVYCEVCDSYFWIEEITVKRYPSVQAKVANPQFVVCPHGCGDINI